MDAKAELLKSRAELASILDTKLKDMPEWRAYRAVEGALLAFGSASNSAGSVYKYRHTPPTPRYSDGYAALAVAAIDAAGRPLTTDEIIEYIKGRRPISGDPKRAKLNIGSSFSKDARMQNIAWQHGRAWWIAG